MTRYQHLATLLAERIEQGLYQSGERLPSVRSLSSEHGVSISTVQQAYHVLEDQQLISPQPRSGYFVSPRKAVPPLPRLSRPARWPVEVKQWSEVLEMINLRYSGEAPGFFSGAPDFTQSTVKPLLREMGRLSQHQAAEVLGYDEIQGTKVLREQIARLLLDSNCVVNADDIVVTNGCHEALSIAIRAVCEPGDIVAVESPSFHGTMQMLRGYGLKVVEIPTDSVTGMSLEALELVLEQWPIKAIFLVPNCNNPQGFIMPDARKKAVLSLAKRYDIAIIEDDVYGELTFEYPRPMTIKSLDVGDCVLLCGSFSKTLAPGLRIGWIVPGRYLDRVLHMKYIGTGSTSVFTQHAIAGFIREGHYHRHLRRMRQQYQRNLDHFSCRVRQYFPCGICVSRPQGGFLLWIELPENVDVERFNLLLREEKIYVASGSLFSASGKYRNCLRLNYALPLDAVTEAALKRVGEIAEQALENT
ncbi:MULTISPECIES: aminotransferase-like domain-containing protein [Enterobacteriaceae]|uniref:aminotransferase-like domain-containing protein n=1 Tax=Enterobacteriaceae TaxID=543 RepID=UPI00141FAC11|nr:PLP-dependent aminotransferase family protein [Enterobacter sp. Ap-1006]NIF49798.1 PLP-dependent aminotransferase family protein [Enterobacter sp. Ap-1006]